MSVINRMLQDLDKRAEGQPREPYLLWQRSLLAAKTARSFSTKKRVATIALCLVAPFALANYAWFGNSVKSVDKQLVLPNQILSDAKTIDSSTLEQHADNDKHQNLPPYALADVKSDLPAAIVNPEETNKDVGPDVDAKDNEKLLVPSDQAESEFTAESQQHLAVADSNEFQAESIATEKVAAKKHNSPLPGPDLQETLPEVKAAIKVESRNRIDSPQLQASNAYKQALMAMDQGQVALAEAKLREALSHYELHLPAREALIGLLIKYARWAEAQGLLYEAISLFPENILFPQRLARLFVETGNELAGISVLENAYGYAKDNPDYLGFLAALYQRNKQWKKAEDVYRQALALRPLEEKLWLGLAVVLETQEHWGAAREAYQKAYASPKLQQNLALFAKERLAALAQKN